MTRVHLEAFTPVSEAMGLSEREVVNVFRIKAHRHRCDSIHSDRVLSRDNEVHWDRLSMHWPAALKAHAPVDEAGTDAGGIATMQLEEVVDNAAPVGSEEVALTEKAQEAPSSQLDTVSRTRFELWQEHNAVGG